MDSVLPIGTKRGCLTIIGGFEVYLEEVAKKKIADLEQKAKVYKWGKISGNNFDSVDVYDKTIQNWKSYKKYQCQCRCGKIRYLDAATLLRIKRWLDCGEKCGLKQDRERKRIASYPREKMKVMILIILILRMNH